jgi:hypothetical protein
MFVVILPMVPGEIYVTVIAGQAALHPASRRRRQHRLDPGNQQTKQQQERHAGGAQSALLSLSSKPIHLLFEVILY